MADLRFFTSDLGSPRYEVADQRDVPLGMWLTMDLAADPTMVLDALAMTDDVASGRSASQHWEGEGFDVAFSKDRVEVVGLHVDSRAEYGFAEVREQVERYWAFAIRLPENPEVERVLRPDLPYWQACLLEWERVWARPHPYRGRLGIPASGPE